MDVPHSIRTVADVAQALALAHELVAADLGAATVPGTRVPLHRPPWHADTGPLALRYEGSGLPPILALASRAEPRDSSGYIDSRASSDEPFTDVTGAQINDYAIVGGNVLRSGRAYCLIADPRELVDSSPRGSQMSATACLTARRYVERIAAALEIPGARVRQLTAEATALRKFADDAEKRAVELTSVWFADVREALSDKGKVPPAVQSRQKYQPYPVQLR